EGPYFDLDTGLTGFEVLQQGTPIGAVARGVSGFTASSQAEVYRTHEWRASGQYSMAVQRADSILEVQTTYAELSSPAWNTLPNGPFSLVASMYAQSGE